MCLFKVSNLFARDEIDEICGELIPVMKKEYPRRPPTPENLYDYFLTRAKRNLHLALCFSPVGKRYAIELSSHWNSSSNSFDAHCFLFPLRLVKNSETAP